MAGKQLANPAANWEVFEMIIAANMATAAKIPRVSNVPMLTLFFPFGAMKHDQ